MISSTFHQLGSPWKGSLWLIIQTFYIYHEFSLKNFWLDDNYAIKPFKSLLFVHGDPKRNFQKYFFFSEKLADISEIRQVTVEKVSFPNCIMLAYTPI